MFFVGKQVLPVLLHVLQTPPLDEEGMVAACGAIVDLCHNLTTDDLVRARACSQRSRKSQRIEDN